MHTDIHAPLWRRLANAQLASTLAAAVWVYGVNSVDEEAAPVEVRLLAAAFRSGWSYIYVRHLLAPSINRVLVRAPRSRAGRLGASLVESLWAQLVDALFFWIIGAERILSVLPFVATNTASIFLAAEASTAGYPPERVAGLIARGLRRG